MSSAIRYFSAGGNTKMVADLVADIAGVPAEPLDTPLTGPVDLLFVGAGVYEVSLDQKVKEYLEQLDKSQVGAVAIFSTSGGDDVTEEMNAIVQGKGIPVKGNLLLIKIGIKNFGIGYEFELAKKDIEDIREFVKSAL